MIHKFYRKIMGYWQKNPQLHKYLVPAVFVLMLMGLYIFSKSDERKVHIYESKESVSLADGRIIGSTDAIYKKREKIFANSVNELKVKHQNFENQIQELNKKIEEFAADFSSKKEEGEQIDKLESIDSKDENEKEVYQNRLETKQIGRKTPLSTKGQNHSRKTAPVLGPAIISFPVKSSGKKIDTVVIPSGSYVKAKVMTGVAAPEGKNYPVLVQLDFAFVGPNRSKIDLSGCFGLAKAQGDLSTERIQMQVTKVSCVAKSGKMFEREVNAFVADDRDHSFAVRGLVHSKQDRTAAMAFLSSVVEGIGKAIQQSQTTQTSSTQGISQSQVTGNQGRYLAAGGASHAASMVTEWYLRQAQNLLPTINIGSGQDVWLILQDKIMLPNWYFRRSLDHSPGIYSYFTRLTDR